MTTGGSTGQPAPATSGGEAAAAYARFDALSRLPPEGAALTLALRSALHPTLRSYLLDPTLPLLGEFVSLDARLTALLSVSDAATLAAAASCLRPDEQELLQPFGLPLISGPHAPWAAVGSIVGAVYVPGVGRAVACRVVVAALPRDPIEEFASWPTPASALTASPAIRESARRALDAAVLLLCQEGRLPPDLLPAPTCFDILAPDLPSDAADAIEGPSLELPLALAFLSALTGLAPPASLAATGAIGDRQKIGEVGWVERKAEAVLAALAAPPRFLIPQAGAAASVASKHLQPVADLRDAAAIAFPQWGSVALPPASPALASRIASGADVTVVCACMPAAADASSVLGNELLQTVLRRAGGDVSSRTVGDGRTLAVFAAFAEPQAALEAALLASQTLRCAPGGSGGDAPALGVHRGSGGDGPEPAERLAEVGAPGAVIVSEAARDGAPETERLRFVPLGAHRLRDLRPPRALFAAVRPAEERRDFGRFLSPTLTDRLHNLPMQTLPLFGREADRATLRRLLHDPATRLVTLVGPGGCGKSRLALEAAAAASDAFPGGVYQVDLDDVRSGDAAAGSTAAVLGLTPDSRYSPTAAAAVLAALADRPDPTLLILDGVSLNGSDDAAEADTGLTDFLRALLTGRSRIVCLASARLPLRLPGEHVYAVGPLGSPPERVEDARLAEAIALSPAGALFLARARQERPHWSPEGPAEWAALAMLCRRLASSPLGLLLAASQAPAALPLPALAARFAADSGTALEAAWSLLPPDLQTFLARLSVFSGGFAADSAEAVAPPGIGKEVLVDEVLVALEERGLLNRRAGTDGAGPSMSLRWHLPPPVRDFARRRLREGGEEAAARQAHARWFLALAERLHRAADTDDERAAFDRLTAERENLHVALAYLRTHAREQASVFVYYLTDFLHYRGHLGEWREWPPLALHLAYRGQKPIADLILSRLHWCCASSLLEIAPRQTESGGGAALDNPSDATIRGHLDDALSLAQRAGDRWALADALCLRGIWRARYEDGAEEARQSYEAALRLYREQEAFRGIVAAQNGLGHLSLSEGNLVDAHARYEEVADLCRRIGDKRGRVVAINNLGFIAANRADFAAAERHFAASLPICRDLGDVRGGAATVYLNRAEALLLLGDAYRAVTALAMADALLDALGEPEEGHLRGESRRLRADLPPDSDEARRYAFLRHALDRMPATALLALDPDDPLAPPRRRLTLDAPIPITLGRAIGNGG